MEKRSDYKSSLNSISNLILDSQNKDINLYTVGHLNETHLWKPPSEKFQNPWEGANKPHITMRPAVFFSKEASSAEKNVTQMTNKLTDFSLSTLSIFNNNNTTSMIKQQKHYTTPSSVPKKDVYVEELKLPDILVANKSTSKVKSALTKSETEKSMEYSDIKNNKLTRSLSKFPKLPGDHLNTNFGFPQSDVEIAFKMLHDPLSGATKKEKFKNLKKFEENVIQISDLSNTNVLFDTKKAKHLESQLQKNLEKFNLVGTEANFHRLQVYSMCLDEIILDKNIFDDILCNIKTEYDNYLYYLLDKLAKNNGEYLREQAELTKSNTLRRIHEIKNVSKENDELEINIINLHKKATELRNQIEAEEAFYQKNFEEEMPNYFSESTITLTSSTAKFQGTTIEDKIQSLKENILKKIKKLTEINEKLHVDCVPTSVITNLTQNIKDTEVEIQKLIKQSEFLDKQIDECENELKIILMNYDTTEFAEENVDYLLKTLKNLDVLQFTNNEKPEDKIKVESNNNNNQNDDMIENEQTLSQRFYDDYFS